MKFCQKFKINNFALKSIFENKIIIRWQDAKPGIVQ